MSTTEDMAPSRGETAARAKSTAARAAARRNSEALEAQVAQLQRDLKGIAATLASLAENKVTEAQNIAKREVAQLKSQGRHVAEDVQDEFGAMERQLKDTIREKPLTAVAGAVALGFLLAVVSR